jgi:type IV pilus assembly protein PilO
VQLTKLQSEIAESRAVESNLKSFEEQQQALRAELAEALQRLPNEKELPVLLTDISSLGKKSGLEIRSFRPETEVEHGFYAEVPIKIEFVGSYHETAVFFDRLSRLSRIVNISELTMAHEDSQADPPELGVRGIATTFRFIDEPEPGGGA